MNEPKTPSPGEQHNELAALLGDVSWIDVLSQRRSRRFGKGMAIEEGPLAYTSQHEPHPLSEQEEAALVFAACGITGHALADLVYAPGAGGTMMSGFAGRTAGSPDAVQTVSLIVSNDEATYLIKRPQELSAEQLVEHIGLAKQGAVTQLYRQSRIQIKEGRAKVSAAPPMTLDVNRWQQGATGSTTFLPINDISYMYINGLLEFFSETMSIFAVDERKNFAPAGVGRFATSKGGHLNDDPKAERTVSIERLESILQNILTVEQGMILQNISLMAQAMGLGSTPLFSAHEYAWFQALGFRMKETPILKYLGASRLVQIVGGWMGKNQPIPYPLGLERDGEVLLKSYAPPYYPTMREAVMAVVEKKFGPQGVFREGTKSSAWQEPEKIAKATPLPTEANIESVIAYCTYIHKTYGRFPAYPPPFRTVSGFQVCHLDLDFYERFYKPDAISDTHRHHHARWHSTSS